jgi:protein-S-isoprenylcysteine O-methyltransferase Ste14
MNKEMNIAGAAPFIAVPTFIYLAITIVISYLAYPDFRITQNRLYIILPGIAFILIGVLMVISCARKLLKSFDNNKLMTDGLYQIFRNPMYAAYMIFIIPGIALLFNSWLALTTVIINYVLFSLFIRKEHNYLKEKFGNDYEEYCKKVLIKFL